MASYKGPNVSVTQQFVTSPGAIAVETLPSVAVGTAYNVHNKLAIGTAYGLVDRTIAWADANPVYDASIAGKKNLAAYPPVAYAVASKIGNANLALAPSAFTSSGIAISRDAMYDLPGSDQIAGACQATSPFYRTPAVASTVTVTIDISDTSIVNVANGALTSAGLRRSQKVFITTNGTTWALIGTLKTVVSDTRLILEIAYGSAISNGEAIIVGSADATIAGIINFGEMLYDPNANFQVGANVLPGDVLVLKCAAVSNTLTATVKQVLDSNTLIFNTLQPNAGYIDANPLAYLPNSDAGHSNTGFDIGATLPVLSYNVQRLAGFSKNYMMKNIGSGVTITKVTSSSFTYPTASSAPQLKAGDNFMLAADPSGWTGEDRDNVVNALNGTLYQVFECVRSGANYLVTVTAAIAGLADGMHLFAWTATTASPLVADYRSIRTEEHNVVKRITSTDDITAAWGTIHPRNDLAFMVQAMFTGAGGRNVCYGINVDSSAPSLTTEYEAALEELKFVDVYSHCFGTTDEGVNAIVGPYCDGQADPYEGHERIGVITYDPDDIFTIGTGGGTLNNTTGAITSITGFNTLTSGITVGDNVRISNASGIYQATATVTATPSIATALQTDYVGAAISTPQLVFMLGNKEPQALAMGSIEYGNRRVAALFPGWFSADAGSGSQLYPPYYIAAAICGMDSGISPSQSFTNRPFSVTGLSSISLGTNTYYRKAQLDEIGGGGIDIMIQDASPSVTIKSRHDLTTDMSAVQYRERSITKQADVAAKIIRTAFAPYVGKYNVNDPNLFKFLGQVGSIVCSTLIKGGVVAAINIDSITRDAVIDDKINISVSMTAFIAGNYYDITMLIKTR